MRQDRSPTLLLIKLDSSDVPPSLCPVRVRHEKPPPCVARRVFSTLETSVGIGGGMVTEQGCLWPKEQGLGVEPGELLMKSVREQLKEIPQSSHLGF